MDEEAGDRPSLGRRLYDLRRRVFGRYTLEDPRPIKREAPYTFYLPPRGELAAIEAGDLVKLMFRGVPPSPVYDVERKWVTVTAAQGERLTGVLESDPFDMPQLRKGALVAFMRGVALDYAADGIRCNCVIPGATDTRLIRDYFAQSADPGKARADLLASIPLGRLAAPEDIGKAALFLTSDHASYITGTTLAVDGGLLAQA